MARAHPALQRPPGPRRPGGAGWCAPAAGAAAGYGTRAARWKGRSSAFACAGSLSADDGGNVAQTQGGGGNEEEVRGPMYDKNSCSNVNYSAWPNSA